MYAQNVLDLSVVVASQDNTYLQDKVGSHWKGDFQDKTGFYEEASYQEEAASKDGTFSKDEAILYIKAASQEIAASHDITTSQDITVSQNDKKRLTHKMKFYQSVKVPHKESCHTLSLLHRIWLSHMIRLLIHVYFEQCFLDQNFVFVLKAFFILFFILIPIPYFIVSNHLNCHISNWVFSMRNLH